jgi:YHS domain-containing protein
MQKRQKQISNPIQAVATQEPSMLCGRRMTVHPDYAIQSEHQGYIIYFCTESCLNAFKADPERFYCAHSKTPPN